MTPSLPGAGHAAMKAGVLVVHLHSLVLSTLLRDAWGRLPSILPFVHHAAYLHKRGTLKE